MKRAEFDRASEGTIGDPQAGQELRRSSTYMLYRNALLAVLLLLPDCVLGQPVSYTRGARPILTEQSAP